MQHNILSYRNFAFAEVDDGKRMFLEHALFKANFSKIIERILDEYGLQASLQEAQAKGDTVRILDFGCGEGLYLHDVAAILEVRNLLSAAEFNGLDNHEGHIAIAEEFSKNSSPPRPYFHFYLYNGLHTLEECPGLVRNGVAEFDFIFANEVIEFLPRAQTVVERLYSALKPGGTIYLRSVALEQSERAWRAWHPSDVQLFGEAIKINANPGITVAFAKTEWLREAGASQVQELADVRVVGGQTEEGLNMLRNSIMILRNLKPLLVATGKMTAAQFDALFNDLYWNANPNLKGQHVYVDTLARKPIV